MHNSLLTNHSRSNEKDDFVTKYEGELRITKNLDISSIASTHILKKLQKDKFLAGSDLLPDTPPVVKSDASTPNLEQRLNKVPTNRDQQKKDEIVRLDIIARLLKMRPIQTILTSGVLGITSAVELALNTKKQREAKNVNVQELSETHDNEDSDRESENKELTGDSANAENADSDDDGEDSDEDEESEIDMDQYRGLVHCSDDSDDDDEDREEPDYNQISDQEPSDEDIDDDDDILTSESGEEEISTDLRIKTKKEGNKESKRDKLHSKTMPEIDRKAKTIILPSLNNGYISPGSDDEFLSDEEGGRRRPASAKPRKNRRGQRARQKIWEQKYGKKATHVAKEEAARKAKEEEKQQKYLERVAKRQLQNSASNANATPLGVQGKAKTDKPLHPSWEARQAKSKPVPFQGKKVVFE